MPIHRGYKTTLEESDAGDCRLDQGATMERIVAPHNSLKTNRMSRFQCKDVSNSRQAYNVSEAQLSADSAKMSCQY